VAEPVDGGALASPRTAGDDSRGSSARPSRFGRRIPGAIRDSGPFGTLLLVLGVAAGMTMIVAEFMTISYVKISSIANCSDLPSTTPGNVRDACSVSGHQQHHWALLVIGLVTIVMAFGSALGRSRPAALALVVLGGAVIGIALIGDHDTLHDTRGLDVIFQNPHGAAGSGYYVEIVAGVVAVLAGGLGFLRKPVD
jgi:hypothetical protein